VCDDAISNDTGIPPWPIGQILEAREPVRAAPVAGAVPRLASAVSIGAVAADIRGRGHREEVDHLPAERTEGETRRRTVMGIRLKVSVVLIGVALVASACSGGDTDVGTTATIPATAPASTSSTTDAAVTTTTEVVTSSTAAPSAEAGVSDTLQGILDRGTIRIGLLPEKPPFRFVAASGAMSGFEVALVSAVAQVVAPGATLEFSEVIYGARFVGLADGAFDMELGTTFHTKEREGAAEFSIPYFLGGLVVLVNADSDVLSLSDLEGKDVLYSYVGGDSAEAAMRDTFAATGASVVGPVQSSLVEFLLTGQAKAAAMVYTDAVFEQSKPGASFRVVPIDILRNPIAISTPVDDVGFQQEVSEALQSLIDDGTWLKLFEEWIGVQPPWTFEEMAGVPPS